MPQKRLGPRVGPMLAVVVALGAMIVLFGLGAAAANRGSGGPVEARSAPATTAPEAPGLGDAVRDGKFEFVVSRVDCKRSTVVFEHMRRTAAGKYCLISLSIRNIADRPQFFLGRVQKVSDAAGTEYGNDELAGLLANRDTQTFLRKIGPGSKVSGKIVFDVPKAATLTGVELHDSYLSGGVRVVLP